MNNITGKSLIEIGYVQGNLIGIALRILKENLNEVDDDELLTLFRKIKDCPESYLDDPVLSPLAKAMIEDPVVKPGKNVALIENPFAYSVYGEAYIEDGARTQMDIAMMLPVTIAGALMPDAHQGYGLPIGGVLATRNAVIPYGVGVDIGCRMALSIFDIPEKHYSEKNSQYKRELIAHTKFGPGEHYKNTERAEHDVLDNPAFNSIPFLKTLQDKAYAQLGTSGGGNHFVEWGIIEFPERDEILNIDKGRYVALLTHSGSRGFGATIARHYTKLAKKVCKLPEVAANLAYLNLDTEAGQEYWVAMNLAGDYASACHEVIHRKLTKTIGAGVLAKIENHHNFAWKEMLNGEEVIVHRKGATPAAKGSMGIIPGSMAAPGFLVRGKGEENAIHSASHGAGRVMSRAQAIQNITRSEMMAILKAHDVTLIGAGLDEAPMAYKDIHKVMAAQTALVDVVAKFEPKMVRMADDGSRED